MKCRGPAHGPTQVGGSRGGPKTAADRGPKALGASAVRSVGTPPPDKKSEPLSGTATHRAGFVTIVGRPNVGKSTLLNALLGQKVAIVSARPQTTRSRIVGVKQLPDAQIVFIDTPGLHAPKGKLGEFMMKTVEHALEAVDAVIFVAEATEDPARLDETALDPLRRLACPVYLCLNKSDLVKDKTRLLPLLEIYASRCPFRELIPISAATGTNLDRLVEVVVAELPVSPPYYPKESSTDQPETFFIAEVIREQLFHLTYQEVPYACAVQVQEVKDREGMLSIEAVIFVEQESQKGIVIGQGGRMLKRIGQQARGTLEAFFGVKVFLRLWVQVRRNWRRDQAALREFGYRLTS